MGSTATNMDGAHIGRIDRSPFNIAGRDLFQIENRYIVGAGYGNTLGATNESEERQRGSDYHGCLAKLKSFFSSRKISKPLQAKNKPTATIVDILPMNQLAAQVDPMSQSTSNMFISEIYARLMSEHGHGYALYQPELDRLLPMAYRTNGVGIGDVGVIQDGSFDFLFNVCTSQSGTNPPDDFELLQPANIDISDDQYFSSGAHVFSLGVNQTSDPAPSYTCSAPRGAVLELPKGATRFRARNTLPLYELAVRHAINWYRYMAAKGIDAHNGSLCIITACIKCHEWGVAYFDRPSTPDDYLQFIRADSSTSYYGRSPFDWRASGPVLTKVGPRSQNATVAHREPNQCIFLRGYRIILPSEVWASIMPTSASR